jgi:hypothetical protein
MFLARQPNTTARGFGTAGATLLARAAEALE